MNKFLWNIAVNNKKLFDNKYIDFLITQLVCMYIMFINFGNFFLIEYNTGDEIYYEYDDCKISPRFIYTHDGYVMDVKVNELLRPLKY